MPKTTTEKKILRCAVYTRKSTEEGLDIRASPLASLENKKEKTIQDISGQMCFVWFKKSLQESVSSKTYPDIYDWGLNKSTMTFKAWVTALRQACSQRRKSAHLINGSGCLFWRTVKATESMGGCLTYKKFKERLDAGMPLSLRDQVKHMWPTVRVSSANGPCRKEILANNPKCRLEVSIVNWATPNTLDHLPPRSPEAMKRMMGPGGARAGAKRPSNLREQINWATPNTLDHLPPRSPEAMKRLMGPNGQRAGRSRPSNLREQINWPTPIASEQKYRLKGNSQQSNGLTSTVIKSHHSLPGQMALGMKSQPVLNPRFVEWLMGWPIGWTEFEPVETVSSHWLPLMRGSLLQLQEMENNFYDR